MEKQKTYHTVRTVPKSNRKTKKLTTPSGQFQNLIEKPKNLPHRQDSSKIQSINRRNGDKIHMDTSSTHDILLARYRDL